MLAGAGGAGTEADGLFGTPFAGFTPLFIDPVEPEPVLFIEPVGPEPVLFIAPVDPMPLPDVPLGAVEGLLLPVPMPELPVVWPPVIPPVLPAPPPVAPPPPPAACANAKLPLSKASPAASKAVVKSPALISISDPCTNERLTGRLLV